MGGGIKIIFFLYFFRRGGYENLDFRTKNSTFYYINQLLPKDDL